MPLVPLDPVPYNYPTGQYRAADPAAAADPASVFVPTVTAAFRQNNMVASFLSNETLGLSNDIAPGYDSWSDIKGTKYEQYWDAFAGSHNPRYTAALKRQIDLEEDDRRTLAGAGVLGALAGITGAVVDPSLLIPYVGTAAKAKGGYSVAKGFLVGASNAALGAGVQEAGLQQSQVLRTGEEGALNIGFATVLGGLVGSGAAALLSKAEKASMQKAYDNLLALQSRNPDDGPPAAGADVVWRSTTDDLTIAGAAANRIAAATQFNPVLRSNFRASARVRETAQLLAENSVYQSMHGTGRSLGAAAETEAKVMRSSLSQALAAHDSLFKNMRKAGINMSRGQFEDAIGQALRNGDVSDNEFVTQAAASWRNTVFEPFKQQAIDAGLLPPDVSVDTALSYFSRVYDQKALTAREQEFKARVMPEVERRLRDQYQQDTERLGQRLAELDRQLSDINLDPEARAAALADIEQQGGALDMQSADQIAQWSEVVALRQQAKAAQESGDTAKAAALLKQAKDKLDGAGEPLRQYLKARAAINKRRRTVDLNFAGLQDRTLKLQQRLVDLEGRNKRGLQRLIARGRVVERRLASMKDEDQIAAELESLETSFRESLAKSDKAQEAHVSAIEKIREEGRTRKLELEQEARDLKAKAKEAKAAGDLKQPALEQKAYEKRVAAAEAKAEADARVIARIERMAKDEARTNEMLRRINGRIEAAKDLDPQALRDEIQRGIDELIAEASDRSLARGEYAQRVKERMAALDPEKLKERVSHLEALKQRAEREYFDRWERRYGGEGVGGAEVKFTDYAAQVVDEVFNKLTGRAVNDGAGALPEYMTVLTRGPMKDRTFNVPDALLTGNPAKGETNFLVDNVREVGERYARIMSGEIALSRRGMLGKEWDYRLREITDEYTALRNAVAAAPDAAAARALMGQKPGVLDSFDAWRKGTGKDAATKERMLAFLQADERAAKEDLHALRDLVRGTYKATDNASSYARVTRGLMTYNYLRLMGGVVVANFTEMFRPAMVHGFAPLFKLGVKPLLGKIDGLKMSVNEAKLANLVTERVTQHRMMQFAEIGDPYARGTAFERLMQNGARLATKWNGLALWTDCQQAISAILSQNRILEGALNGNGTRLLDYLGLDASMAKRVAKQFSAHGETLDGIHVANTERWDDIVAVRAYRAAVRKDVDSIIVMPGVGDVPLFAHTPTGKMIMQFRSFTMAAHQRVLLRGLQEDKARFLGGLVVMTGLGTMASALRAYRSGHERWEQWKSAAENPGYLVGEGLDMSGIFTLAFEASNMAEKLSQGTGAGPFNPIKSPLMAAFPNASQQGASTRFVSRDPIGAVLGPTAGLPSQALRAAGMPLFAAQGEDATKGQVRAATGLIPFSSYPGFREIIQLSTGDSPYTR